MRSVNIHSVLAHSAVNGPGLRTTVWFQGCSKACPGCFNPHTWDFAPAHSYTPAKLKTLVRSFNDDGLTLTGGDPFEQPEALLEFLERLHARNSLVAWWPAGILCYTGYTYQQLKGDALMAASLPYIDVLVDGRYVETKRIFEGPGGSENQRCHFNPQPGRGRDRIQEDALRCEQSVELHTDQNEPNRIAVTGFPGAAIETSLCKLGLSPALRTV